MDQTADIFNDWNVEIVLKLEKVKEFMINLRIRL